MKLSSRQLAGVFLLVGATIIGAAYYLRQSAKLSVGQMVSLLPTDPGAVGYMDVSLIRRSGVLDKISRNPVAEEADYRKFVDATGFDYKRDLDALMSYSAEGDYLFLAQGTFDWDRLQAYAKKQGGVCRGEICRTATSRPNRWLSFYPVRNRVMAIAIAADEFAASRIGTKLSPPLSVPDAPVWLSVPGSSLRSAEGGPAGTKQFLRLLSDAERMLMTLGASGDRFELTMDVTCKTAEQAAILRTDLQNLTAMLRKFIAAERQEPNPTDLSGVLTSGAFAREGSHVIGRWPIERAFLESLGGT